MVFEEIQALVEEVFEIDASEVTMESSIKDDLKFDSLDLFEFISDVQEHFDIEIPTEDLTKMETVADVVNYIEQAKK